MLRLVGLDLSTAANHLTATPPLLTLVNTMPPPLDPDMRRAALALIALGEASPAEVADALGVSRQVVHRWVTVAGIDWARVRRARLLKALTKRREDHEKRKRPSV